MEKLKHCGWIDANFSLQEQSEINSSVGLDGSITFFI